MSTEPLLTAGDLAIGSLLVLANAGLSLGLQLGLARAMLVASARAAVQLLLVGLVLKTVFALQSPWLVALVLMLMFGAATHEIVSRQERRLTGLWSLALGSGSALVATVLATLLGLAALRPEHWMDARAVIPLMGLVLGSVMNGVTLSLNAFVTAVTRDRVAIEAQLCLGATREQALRAIQLRALRSGLVPILNQMSAAGIVTLPGMMSGQILAGMPAVEAAKYQILVLLLLAGGAGLGAIGASYGALWRLTDERHRLRLDRLQVRDRT